MACRTPFRAPKRLLRQLLSSAAGWFPVAAADFTGSFLPTHPKIISKGSAIPFCRPGAAPCGKTDCGLVVLNPSHAAFASWEMA
ncbi:MAG: hypothetical protein M2R45_03698 [Verrucomicrobia subdivision 3 bacterium]|nr:hypothetical protein [Limisphaerales bacterium]MCS1414981.1 hypothetical protein [Limisphaerales bacterium]